MTKEIKFIQDEIHAIRIADLDIAFMEALSNNAIYCINKYLKEQATQISPSSKKSADTAITDILETLSKEISWAKEELKEQNDRQAKEYLHKAKQQVLESMQQLF